jgi:RND superfamily putative drug exporter
VWITTAVLLGALAFGLTDLKANGLTAADSFVTRPDSVVGARVLAAHYPAGGGDPVMVVGASAAAGALHDVLAGMPDLTDVTEPAVTGDHAYLEGTLLDPPDTAAGQATVERVRTAVRRIDGARALVGGSTATALDANTAARHDRNLVIPLVLLVVLVILGLLLRAVVAPLILVGTVVLSFAAALGVSALVFDHVFGFGGGDTSMPLFVFVFLVALGIDYNIFLMTRVREEAARLGARRGALAGLAATGSVITSAGLVLAGTFAALGTLPATATAEIGFAVAFGVLLDTFLVRSVLVTALNLDLGRWMWWPGRLGARRDPPGTAAPPAGQHALETAG